MTTIWVNGILVDNGYYCCANCHFNKRLFFAGVNTMKVTIYLKTETGWQPTSFYEFSEGEFNRLQNDFENYKATGEPKMGVYYRNTDHPDRTNTVVLNFEYIAIIESTE